MLFPAGEAFLEEYEPYLAPTAMIDSDHPDVRRFAESVTSGAESRVEAAVRLYLAVRDGIRYNPYMPFQNPEDYQASRVLRSGRGFCIPKASLLCALARASGIPCRLGFADVRNHLATRELIEFLGADVFVFHAFVEFLLDGRWTKATPAFNKELCERHGVPPLEFNGVEDSLFQPYNDRKQKYMEYLKLRGSYEDVPLSEILSAWSKTYGPERLRLWARAYEKGDVAGKSRFELEEVWKG